MEARLRDCIRWTIIPVSNPDGYVYTMDQVTPILVTNYLSDSKQSEAKFSMLTFRGCPFVL